MEKKLNCNNLICRSKRISRIVKLSVLFLFIGICYVEASPYSQSTQLKLNTENKTVREILTDIEKSSEFIFFYNDNALNLDQKVDVSSANGNISQVLDKVLKGHSVGYRVEDRQVVLYSTNKAKEEKSVKSTSPQQAKRTVKGHVIDANGESLVGVSVLVKGTNNGTLTDVDGNFSIAISTASATLQFSYIGYNNEVIKVNAGETVKVVMKENVKEIQEVVVTAPVGVQRQAKALGYAVSTVTAKQLTEAGNTNFASALYGKAAGVKITTAPGGASSAVNVQIRGVNSLNYNQQPLYVVDGIMIRNDGQNGATGANNNNYWDDQRIRGNGALDINPEDIESLTVLKGASATALYGSDAASGVVVITTKKASKDKGLGVDLNYNLTAEKVAFLPKFQNVYGPGYDQADNIASGATAEGWIADSSSPSGYRPFFRSYGNFGPKMEGQQVKWWDGSIRSYSPQPDNYKNIYQTGLSSNLNLALSNQTEKLNYRLSYTRMDYKGTQRGSEQARNTFNLNSTLKLTNSMTLDIIASYMNTTTHNRPYQLGQVLGSYGGFFSRAEDMSLMLDKYQTSDGYKYVTYNHPERSSEAFVYNIRATNLLDFFWQQLRNKYNETENRLISSATLNWNIIDHLKFRGRIGSDYTGANTENKQYNEYSVAYNSGTSTGSYGVTNGVYSILYGDALLSYANKIGSKFNYTASLGYQGRSENYKDQSSSTTQGLITENWFTLNNSYGLLNSSSKRQELLKYAYLGILNMSYHDYLFLEGTARQEYSSTLPPKNNHFFYPSVNGSFVLSEAFKLPKEISYAKLRASYGIVGNAAPMYVSNIAYTQSSLQTINGSVPSLVLPSTYGNENLKAETKYEREIGLETRFLEDRIGLDISFYTNTVKNQIMDLSTAASVGATGQTVNVGEIGSKGLELAFNATPINGPVRWMTRFNISFNKSKVNSLAPNVPQLIFYDSEQSALRVVAKPGEELGNIYVYPRATNADGKFIINDDGLYVIDKTKYVKVGNIMPKAVGGFSNTVMYKNLSLDFTIDYRIGGKMISNPTKYMMGAGMFENTMQYRDTEHGGLTYTSGSTTYHDGVLLEGVNQTTGQANTKVIDAGTYYMNTFGWGYDAWNEKGSVYNNSYIKLREATLSYRVPASICKKLCMNNVKVSLIGRNLLYLWRTLENIDPEAPLGNKWWSQGIDVGSTASSRSFGFSLSANF